MNELRADHLVPKPSNFSPTSPIYDEAMRRHDEAVAANAPGYSDPTSGLFVFTAVTLSQRPCCGSGCRHCPYE